MINTFTITVIFTTYALALDFNMHSRKRLVSST